MYLYWSRTLATLEESDFHRVYTVWPLDVFLASSVRGLCLATPMVLRPLNILLSPKRDGKLGLNAASILDECVDTGPKRLIMETRTA